MEQAFKIINQNTYGPSKTCAQYDEYTMQVVYAPGFPRLDSEMQKAFITAYLEDEITLDIETHIMITPPGHLDYTEMRSFGLFVFDHEISTLIKLKYS